MSAARPPEGARTAVRSTQGNPVQALPADFAPRLIRWQARDGRHGLPWQGTRYASTRTQREIRIHYGCGRVT